MCHYARDHSQDSQQSSFGGGVVAVRYDEVFVVRDGGDGRALMR